MRSLIVAIVLLCSTALEAQTLLQNNNNVQQLAVAASSNQIPNKKWFVTKYAGLNTGFSFFKGGNAFFTSMPVGIQLNRRITNNVYAFAGVQVAPSYINFNQSFLSSSSNKYAGIGGFNQNQLLLPAKAELGLMYMNDQKTFSISGSISVQKNNYPLLPYYQPAAFSMPYYRR